MSSSLLARPDESTSIVGITKTTLGAQMDLSSRTTTVPPSPSRKSLVTPSYHQTHTITPGHRLRTPTEARKPPRLPSHPKPFQPTPSIRSITQGRREFCYKYVIDTPADFNRRDTWRRHYPFSWGQHTGETNRKGLLPADNQ